MRPRRDAPTPARTRRAALSLLAALTAGLLALEALAGLRPLVREMLENLAEVNDVGEALALEDYARIAEAGASLRERARALKGFDITRLGVDATRDAQFDAFLGAQEEASAAIVAAAREKDGRGVLLGMQQLFGNACLGCHAEFRERENLLRPSVLLMTTLLNSWKDVNRGLAVKDFELVARRSREIESVARVFTWDQVIQATFGIESAEERSRFRSYLTRVIAEASRMEQAAIDEKPTQVMESSRRMWEEGCLRCHARFRKHP